MGGQDIGYVRVSSVDQKTDRQLIGIELDKVFTDKCSGKDRKRPELQNCLEHLREGDTLHVHSIDRLARNLGNLLELLEELIGKGVGIEFHKEKLTFTGEANPMQKLQLQIMGSVAEFERSMILERQREGIAAAKAKGKSFGRPAKITKELVARIRELKTEGKGATEIGAQLDVSRATVYNALKRREAA